LCGEGGEIASFLATFGFDLSLEQNIQLAKSKYQYEFKNWINFFSPARGLGIISKIATQSILQLLEPIEFELLLLKLY